MGKKIDSCIVCGEKVFEDYCNKLAQCTSCGFVMAKEIPTEKEINDLYQKEYFLGKEYFDYKSDRLALEWNFKGRIKGLSHAIKPTDTIVEIGCAYGFFLNLIKDKVDSHIGFDVAEDVVGYAKKEFGLNVTSKDFLKYDIKENSVDNVFMWDVIEHLTNPDVFIKKITKILKKDGRIILTTGNIGALLPRLRKGKWRMIHPPTHVYYFNPDTVTKLLENNGLEVERIKHVGVSRNVGSIFNQIINNRRAMKKDTMLHNAGLSLARSVKFDKLNIPINTFDIMEVVARKIQ